MIAAVALVGFLDDCIKVRNARNRGIFCKRTKSSDLLVVSLGFIVL